MMPFQMIYGSSNEYTLVRPQANKEIGYLKSQLKESVLSKQLVELERVDQEERAGETGDAMAHLKAQLAATESQLAHARADLQVRPRACLDPDPHLTTPGLTPTLGLTQANPIPTLMNLVNPNRARALTSK